MPMTTHMTLERGVLWFEDGTEVSNVSVDLLKAAPLLKATLAECLDALYNETHGQPDSPWVKKVKAKARIALERAGD